MFDLGGTLIDDALQPFPHAPAAVAAIGELVAVDGLAVKTCLVSDFDMVSPPDLPAKIEAAFARYLAILAETPFAAIFKPSSQRITLSMHAGVLKPDRHVFETALGRLKTQASLSECLLITENAAHIDHVRKNLGMKALRFGATDEDGFDDWSDALALVANLVSADQASHSD